ncbi:hypothetical protein DCAR_0310223 [Daucus carota subsp. sativus]|uniref:GPI ethanolamine phosphate transferase 3 n=2 Tax=Daucus carota subsp. sativus TaxID=79200 RepID=A0AAF1ASQ0_DAUCS|nr:PREDICTED: GPI ethanolamine phosphate transferase 2 isoform X1 [Daucus carota subsp. sativus]WOG90976.1 hypothetical protein DCAR_0310223 [Daucus carota subsp. sativus]
MAVFELWRSENWGSKNWAFSIFLSILLLHCIAIVLFTSGFLLTRTELSQFSRCSDVFESPCFRNQESGLGKCWTKPAVDRVVIIVLDALRFDFVAPSTFFEEKKPWMDKLQVLHKLTSQLGSSAKIFKAIADPPTTSLQRMKGLTTGGLPTFIDVGNSFGAPAIVEDNLIHQLVQNGKRVVMMGDDTWLQCFPHHFNKSYPFPSFNVKDLDTVDNGCTEHLFPTLYEKEWDVLIAHYLGVDHAGHIFGVDSTPMIDKLEQYNNILEKVVDVLVSQSGSGGLHENTLLLVMGDHGQTLNGDHGGGSPEEVETSIFAMSMQPPPASTELDTSYCKLDLAGREVCVDFIEQLDFAATLSALLGVPFPYGSIGRINPVLYALGPGTWNRETHIEGNCQQTDKEAWMHNYVDALCINSWQVKKYIDVYSASSVIGFSKEDLLQVTEMYTQAEKSNFNRVNDSVQYKVESCHSSVTDLKRQIDLYDKFLASVAELARTKWTEFNLEIMAIGFGFMLISIAIHFLVIKRLENLQQASSVSNGSCRMSLNAIFAYLFVAIRACSVLSNSYILEEGKVAAFLLATTAILCLRSSILNKKLLTEAIAFILLISILRFTIELGLSKQATNSSLLTVHLSWILRIDKGSSVGTYITEIVPILAMTILAYLLHKSMAHRYCPSITRYVIKGTIFSYMLIGVQWILESDLISFSHIGIKANIIPRMIYAIGVAQLLSLVLGRLVRGKNLTGWKDGILLNTVAMLSAWSSTVIVLSGKQGAFVALASIAGGWLILRLQGMEQNSNNGKYGTISLYSASVTQWSLLAACLFFGTGHWCAFDGLRYAAAFIGFDEFNLIRQAILLTIETFGFSLLLPIFGLPLLVIYNYDFNQNKHPKRLLFMQLSQVFLMYGLVTTITVTFTIICVTIQRRHLMVWGLFAPKFVFDVAGLILTDFLICAASLFIFE